MSKRRVNDALKTVMIRVAMLLDYPVPELASQLGIAQGFHPGSVPQRTLIGGLMESRQVTLDLVTTTKLLAGARTIDMGERLRLHILGVPKFSGMPVGFVPRIRLLHQYLEQLEPDIVHGQGTEREFGIAAVTSRWPNVLTVHGILREVHKVTKPRWRSPEHIGRWVERIALRKARHIIAISPYVQRVLSSAGQRQFYPVPNPVSPVFFGVKKPKPGTKVVFSALIGPHKGLPDLIEAARRLQVEGVTPHWTIVGKSSLQFTNSFAACQALAQRCFTSDLMEFPGWLTQEAFAGELREACCLVHPSYCENSPMVIAEAMASGTPAVACGVGGVPDLIEDGVNGFLVPPGDVDLLAQRVRTLVLNPELARTFGERAREKALSFRPEVVAEKTLRAYERVLQEGATR